MIQIVSGSPYLFIVYTSVIHYTFVFVTKGIKGKISEVIDIPKWIACCIFVSFKSTGSAIVMSTFYLA